jgi:hypothetical protein
MSRHLTGSETTTTATAAATPPDSSTPKQVTTEYIHRAAWKAGVLGALNLATAILAVRLTLLVSVGGAIGVAYLVLKEPDPYRLGALAVYAVVVVVPLIWLAARR